MVVGRGGSGDVTPRCSAGVSWTLWPVLFLNYYSDVGTKVGVVSKPLDLIVETRGLIIPTLLKTFCHQHWEVVLLSQSGPRGCSSPPPPRE